MKTPVRKGSALKSREGSDAGSSVDHAVMNSGYVALSVMQTPPRVTRKQDDIFMPKPTELALAPTVSSSYEDVSPKDDLLSLPPAPALSSGAPTLTGLQSATKPNLLPPSSSKASRAGLPPSSSSKAKRGLSTPIRMKNKLFSAKKLKKCLTPPREGFASHLKQLRSSKKMPNDEFLDVPPPSPASLSTALPGADEFKIHSTEYDPFDFQCELPAKKEMSVHAKICNVVDSYTSTHLEFNFAMLAGLTRGTLEKEYQRTSDDKPMIAGACHRDVVKSILDCEDDLVVEGFFREYVGDNNTNIGDCKTPKKAAARDDRIEAVVFSSEKLRQIIVCFRGSTASQAKPLKMNYFGKEGEYKCVIDLCPCHVWHSTLPL